MQPSITPHKNSLVIRALFLVALLSIGLTKRMPRIPPTNTEHGTVRNRLKWLYCPALDPNAGSEWGGWASKERTLPRTLMSLCLADWAVKEDVLDGLGQLTGVFHEVFGDWLEELIKIL
ncbi:hypothetical protein BGY98DRAFT_1008592 [Russula aff. rugulosa BPL654]|nr:hypothetical protein BGY98DRAFT_1008592 [Russula aff. rugulosa BPL654]